MGRALWVHTRTVNGEMEHRFTASWVRRWGRPENTCAERRCIVDRMETIRKTRPKCHCEKDRWTYAHEIGDSEIIQLTAPNIANGATSRDDEQTDRHSYDEHEDPVRKSPKKNIYSPHRKPDAASITLVSRTDQQSRSTTTNAMLKKPRSMREAKRTHSKPRRQCICVT